MNQATDGPVRSDRVQLDPRAQKNEGGRDSGRASLTERLAPSLCSRSDSDRSTSTMLDGLRSAS